MKINDLNPLVQRLLKMIEKIIEEERGNKRSVENVN